MNRVLILFAHPALEKSRVNKALVRSVRGLEGVTFRDLYEEYPDLQIDVKQEQKLLEDHEVVVFQHPFYWYSAPAIVKEWIDLVLEYGYAYGDGGDRLAGKSWIHALTAGGTEAAYTRGGGNRFTVRELLAPFEQTAHLCGMSFLPPFVIHDALSLEPGAELQTEAQRYREALIRLQKAEGAHA